MKILDLINELNAIYKSEGNIDIKIKQNSVDWEGAYKKSEEPALILKTFDIEKISNGNLIINSQANDIEFLD